MEGLSKKEIEIISSFEFDEKYFFTSDEIQKFAKDKPQRYNIIKSLLKKGRIIKLSKAKYFLIPIKAKSGSWMEHPFILADEMLESDYFIGGYAAANYWGLTEQVPMQIDIYTTKRQGKSKVMNSRFVFHRTTRQRIKETVEEHIGEHPFRILKKEESKKWIASKS